MSMDDERIMAEAILTRGLHTGEEVTAVGERIGNRRTTQVAMAVFEAVMERKYSSSRPSVDDIVEYSRYMGRSYGNDESPISPLVVEAVMRAYEGESGLLRGFSIDEIIRHQTLISYDLFSSMRLDEQGLNDTVSEALEIAKKLA